MWKLARNFTTAIANKTRDALFPRKKYACKDKIRKVKVPNKLLLSNDTGST